MRASRPFGMPPRGRRGVLTGVLGGIAAALPGIPELAAADLPPPFYSQAGQFVQLRPRLPAPAGPLPTGGTGTDLARLAGKVVVLNFWATWCAPCIAELPTLDRLAADPGRTPTAVLPIALDAPDTASVAAFFQAHGIRHLPVLIDPRRRIGHLGGAEDWHDLFPVAALPTTFLLDPRGKVAGYVLGAAVWDSAAARRLIGWIAQ